jgi:hypothetical protein
LIWEKNGSMHRNLDLEHACWNKRAIFFQLVSTLFCEVKRGFVEPCKMFQCSKLPCLGWRSADFCFRLVLRFLWFDDLMIWWRSQNCRKTKCRKMTEKVGFFWPLLTARQE